MENKYQNGDIVHSKTNPLIKLVVRRSIGKIYYCIVQNDTNKKESIFLENDLIKETD